MKRAMLSIVTAVLAAAGGTAYSVQQLTEPLILLDPESRVVACGARVSVTYAPNGGVELALQVTRDPEGAKTVLSVIHVRDDEHTAVVAAALDVGDRDIVSLLTRVTSPQPGPFRAEAHLPAGRHGELFRDFLLSGGRLTLRLGDGTEVHYDIRGPAPRKVFADYLRCSGDLYRRDRINRTN